MRRSQRGASLLIPVLLVITVVAFAVVLAASQSGGDVQGSSAVADSVEALLLAETGVERAMKRFATGTACGALGETLIDLSSLGLAGRSIAVSVGASSNLDFDLAALGPAQCRIEVRAEVAASRVSRTVQAILDVGSLGTFSFNDPAGPGAPAGWIGGAYDYTGGPDPIGANPLACTRAAYAVRPRPGGFTASSAGTTPVSFSLARPATVLVEFDYRIIQVGNSGSSVCITSAGGGACPGAADATSPGGTDGEICMTMRDTPGGATYDSTKYGVTVSASIPQTVSPAACVPTTQQSPTPAVHTPCSTQYNQSGAAAAQQGTVRFTFGGSGTISFDRVGFNLYIPGGAQGKEIWVDNLNFTVPGGGVAMPKKWRDCSASACPSV
jgi:hypothetical protein